LRGVVDDSFEVEDDFFGTVEGKRRRERVIRNGAFGSFLFSIVNV